MTSRWEVNTDALPPSVFTCGQCHRVLTDSQEYVCSIEELGILTMRGISYQVYVEANAQCCG